MEILDARVIKRVALSVASLSGLGVVACSEAPPIIDPGFTPAPVVGKPSPAAQETSTILAPLIFNFSQELPTDQRAEIETSTRQIITWLKNKTGVSLGEVTVFADNNPTRIIEQYLQRTNFSESQKAQEREDLLRGATAWAGRQNDFFIITTSPGWVSNSPIIGGPVKEGRVHIKAHELFHLLQVKYMAHQRIFPYWLWEGSAHYVAAQFLGENNVFPYLQIVSGHKSQAVPMIEKLDTLETTAFFSAGTPYADEYSLAFLATQFLVNNLPNGGINELSQFWDTVGKGTPWRTAFEQIFKQSPEKFYNRFADWRQQNFEPSLTPIS